MNGFIPGRGTRLFTKVSGPAIDPITLPMQWVPEALYLGVKYLQCENDNSSLFGAKVRNVWCLIHQRSKFSCTFYNPSDILL